MKLLGYESVPIWHIAQLGQRLACRATAVCFPLGILTISFLVFVLSSKSQSQCKIFHLYRICIYLFSMVSVLLLSNAILIFKTGQVLHQSLQLHILMLEN